MFKAFRQSFIGALIANLCVVGGVIWGIYEIISWFVSKDTEVIDPINFNFFWLIGVGFVGFVIMFIRAFNSATKDF
ncbi:MAG: hypothetical protein P8J32_07090 [bacterium]|nr:hypothetical protein [bacterium]